MATYFHKFDNYTSPISWKTTHAAKKRQPLKGGFFQHALPWTAYVWNIWITPLFFDIIGRSKPSPMRPSVSGRWFVRPLTYHEHIILRENWNG